MTLHSGAGLDSVQTISKQTCIFVLQGAGTDINDLYDSVFSSSFFERKAGAAGMSHHVPSYRLRKMCELQMNMKLRCRYLLGIWHK
jgi:hypothetical protein